MTSDLEQPVFNVKDLPKKLDEMVDEFQRVATQVDEMIDPIVFGTERADMFTHMRLYAVMDHIKNVCAVLDTMCNKNMPIAAERAERLMSMEECDEFRFMGKIWKCDTKVYVQMKAEDKPKCVAWLKTLESGKHLVSEQYHPLAWLKFMREEIIAKGVPLPPYMSTFNKPTLSVRKIPAARNT